MNEKWLRLVKPDHLPHARKDPVDADTIAKAAVIVDEVRLGGEEVLREYGERFGDLEPDAPLLRGPEDFDRALASLSENKRETLLRTASRIESFANAQRGCLGNVYANIEGGHAGHDVSPVERAGCYAPGGRFPLPSSVLMTAVTARVAGVDDVIVASPKPTVETLAACAVAKADSCLTVGGAQAIAALAYGVGPVSACDVIVGPGNRWVTAAKKLVSGRVAIDMLAGPSELVVFADGNADPTLIAADLLAQAEHDPDALPVLVSTDESLIEAVREHVEKQVSDLPTASTAIPALENGFCVAVNDIDEGIAVCDQLAPEHLEVLVQDAETVAKRLSHYGGLFIGAGSAEVLGDYGAGPNHVLPTGATARFTGGLSVFDFLRVRTWMRVEDLSGAASTLADAVVLARMEGLEGHARAAERRLK